MPQSTAIFYKLGSLISKKLGLKTDAFESAKPDLPTVSEPPVEPSSSTVQPIAKPNGLGDPLSSASSVAQGATEFSKDARADHVPVLVEGVALENSTVMASDARDADGDAPNTPLDRPSNLAANSETAGEESDSKQFDLPSENAEDYEEFSMDYDDIPATSYSEEQLAESKRALTQLMRSCAGVYGLLIHTVDGHDLLSVFTRDLPSTKISTMTSSFLALGETIASESLQKFCQFAMLENSNGRVISLRINQILMLTCISTKESNPGMLLSTGKSAADAIAKILVSPS